MRIAIIGYGKMGKTIEKIAERRGHSIDLKINRSNKDALNVANLRSKQIDIAIEFTNPESALNNLLICFEANVKVVSGSTGWLDDWQIAIQKMEAKKGSFIYASNFSVGVNIFFALNSRLAALMNTHSEYEVAIKEIHHTAKLDAPSGTAITLANGVIENLERKSSWTKNNATEEQIRIESERIDPAPGTHHVKYSSTIDDLEIIHTAKSREGFALGAVLAAEYLEGRIGLYNMKDVLAI